MRLPMLRSDGRPKTNLTYSKVRIMKNLVTALIFTFATTVWAGDFEDGFAASEAGDYKTLALCCMLFVFFQFRDLRTQP